MPKFEAISASYLKLWNAMVISPSKIAAADQAARRILAGKARYLEVEKQTSVPWFFIGLCHLREGNLSFSTYLGNGQALNRVTTIVPKGRGPFPSFEVGAVDALRKMGFTAIKDWSLERIAYCLEGFNGYGYRSHGVNSPYLWAGTNQYTRGKYVRDGVFDPSFVDTQLGSMAVLARLCAMDADVNARLHGIEQAANAPAAVSQETHATAPATLPNPGAMPQTSAEGKQLGGAAVAAGIFASAWQYIMGSGAIRVLLVLAIAFAVYWFLARPMLRRLSALQGFYAHVDEIEGGLWMRVRLAAKGIKTRLLSFFLGISTIGTSLLQYAEIIDVTKMPNIGSGDFSIPASLYMPLLLGTVIPWAYKRLRQVTTTPEGQTDLALAMPEAPPLVPDVPEGPAPGFERRLAGAKELKSRIDGRIKKSRKRARA